MNKLQSTFQPIILVSSNIQSEIKLFYLQEII